jgi:hypothetical protein
MRVYRFEDAEGCGVYNSEIVAIPDCFRQGRNHSEPWDDFKREVYDLANALRAPKSVVLFGFVSGPQCNDWFPAADRLALRRMNARLIAYEVPKESVIEGRYQCVYDSRKAVLAAPASSVH